MYGSYVAIVIISAGTIAQVVSAILPSVIPTEATQVELAAQGVLGLVVTALIFGGHLVHSSLKRGLTWAQRLWIPVEQLTLPELEQIRSPTQREEDVEV